LLKIERTESLEIIMDMYGDEVKRFIYTYVKNQADTDDIIQEVFVTIYNKLDTFKGNSSLKSWIYSIAINKCKDYLRSWKVRNQKLKERLTYSRLDSGVNEESPETYTIQQSESNELLNFVLNLPVKYREVIILFYFEDMT